MDIKNNELSIEESIKNTIEQLENRLLKIDERNDSLEAGITSLEISIADLARSIGLINNSISALTIFAKNTNTRLDNIEKTISPLNLTFKPQDVS